MKPFKGLLLQEQSFFLLERLSHTNRPPKANLLKVSLHTSYLTSLESTNPPKALVPQLAQLSANYSHQHPAAQEFVHQQSRQRSGGTCEEM